ncbi:MAG: TolB family protein [Chloroflexota bacterium]
MPVFLLDDARYPGPSPDGGHIAFVRSVERGAAIFVHSVPDGTDTQLVAPGPFLAVAYPRFSPDGQQLALTAISLLAPIGHVPGNAFAGRLGVGSAEAHGIPWETWLVNADGSDLRQIPDILDDDPSVAWSPDGKRLMVYGGWGALSWTPRAAVPHRCHIWLATARWPGYRTEELVRLPVSERMIK